MSNTFSYKLTTENELFFFDFSQVLAVGETLSTATCTVSVISGTDPSPSSIKSGSMVLTPTQASQRILGGIASVTYRLVVTVTTSASNTYTTVGDLPVYSPEEI